MKCSTQRYCWGIEQWNNVTNCSVWYRPETTERAAQRKCHSEFFRTSTAHFYGWCMLLLSVQQRHSFPCLKMSKIESCHEVGLAHDFSCQNREIFRISLISQSLWLVIVRLAVHALDSENR